MVYQLKCIKLSVGTEKDQEARHFYGSLQPTTRVTDGKLFRYTWVLPQGLRCENFESFTSSKWKTKKLRALHILDSASSDLTKLKIRCSSNFAVACVVTPHEVAYWPKKRFTRDRTTKKSVFCLASLSKWFINICTRLCYQKHLLDYKDPISKYVDVGLGDDITIFHVVFNGGLPRMNDVLLGPDGSVILKLEDFIKVARNCSEESREIQSMIEYSNANSLLLRLIIEKASGMSYLDFLKKEFFERLGMRSTFITKEELDRLPKKLLFTQSGSDIYLNPVCLPAMGVHTSMEDLGILFKELLASSQNKGKLGKESILDIDVFRTALDLNDKSYSLFGEVFEPNTNVGSVSRNCELSPTAERSGANRLPEQVQCRTGSINGFDSCAFYVPKHQAVVIVGASTSNYMDNAYYMALRIVHQLLGSQMSLELSRVQSEIQRYEDLTLSHNYPSVHLPPLNGCFVCAKREQRLDFDPTSYTVMLSERSTFKYSWISKSEIILLPSKPALEWIRCWKYKIFEVEWCDNVVVSLVRIAGTRVACRYTVVSDANITDAAGG